MSIVDKRRISESEVAGALARAWRRDTSYDPDGWSRQNPSWGQCAVSALIIQDLLGGDLLLGKVNGLEHYWNKIGRNKQLDVTKGQFGSIRSFEGPFSVTREFVLSFPDTSRRYQRLRERVLAQLKGVNGRKRRAASA